MIEGAVHIDEILREVAKEESMSMRAIRDVWKHQEHYAKKKMMEPDTYCIFLPFIGTLAFNVKVARFNTKHRPAKYLVFLREKLKSISEHPNFQLYENAHKRIPGLVRLAKMVIREYKTEVDIDSTGKVLSVDMSLGLAQKYSNDLLEKRDEPLSRKSKRQKKLERLNAYEEIS